MRALIGNYQLTNKNCSPNHAYGERKMNSILLLTSYFYTWLDFFIWITMEFIYMDHTKMTKCSLLIMYFLSFLSFDLLAEEIKSKESNEIYWAIQNRWGGKRYEEIAKDILIDFSHPLDGWINLNICH